MIKNICEEITTNFILNGEKLNVFSLRQKKYRYESGIAVGNCIVVPQKVKNGVTI